ncbi:MAG: hypothetical protein IJB86_07505 [Clostridia bacterium]|nr:hypothetical protein [Clostridia bacterium]
MQIYKVAFFGHRFINNVFKVENLLKEQILKLLSEKSYVEFLVGRNGDFDQCVSSSVISVKKSYRDDNSSLILVLPYLTAEFLNNKESFSKYYDEIEITCSDKYVHPKAAFKIRNRQMVDRADLVICYVEKNEGGARQTVRYATEQGKMVINLAEKDIE